MSDQAPTSPRLVGQGPLAAFTLDLAQAMIRHGYYAPGHPEAERSLSGLYRDFCAAVGEGSGLTYLVGQVMGNETLMVQGPGDGPETLDRVMARGMAELFAPKFLDFFHRRRLVSFTLRAAIGADELSDFVTLMSEPPTPDTVSEERGRVEKALLDKHIINVSTVFESDRLGRKRKLPWRVEMALSRLGRDLRVLPLFQRASAEEIEQVKIQILDDIIRPLQAPELVRDFLLNCDLLADDIEELEDARIEEEIIAQVPHARLSATCRVIVDDMVAAPSDPLAPRRRLVLRHLLVRLLQEGIELDPEILETCVAMGAATFDELPKEVRGKLKRRRAVDTFLVRKEEYLEALSHVPAGERGVQLAKTGEAFFTELLHRECYVEAAQVMDAMLTGSHEGEGAPAVREAIDRSRAVVCEVRVLGPILHALGKESTKRSLAEALIPLAALGGRPAGDQLRALYRERESRTVKGHVFEAIKRIGADALIPFLEELPEIEHEWSAVHHAIAALADVKDPALVKPISRFLQHENAHVRQAALARIFALDAAGSEGACVEALSDNDVAVRHAAVSHLGSLGSQNPAAMAFFTAALCPPPGDTPAETSDEVLVEVCRSLVLIAKAAPEKASGIEETLLNALTESDQGKLLGRLRKATPHFSDPVRLAVCEALATMGTEWSLPVLDEMSQEEGAVGEACASTAARIRGSGGSPEGST